MTKLLLNSIPVFIFILFLFWSCETPPKYSTTPEISFKSISLSKATDDLGNVVTRSVLLIKLIDGDGDVGLPEDTLPLFADLGNKNLFIKMYKKTTDGFIENATKIPLNYRTPYLIPEGQDKTLIADIEVTMDFSAGSLPADSTIKFDFYIYDRRKHMSNIAETPEFPSDTLGTIKATGK